MVSKDNLFITQPWRTSIKFNKGKVCFISGFLHELFFNGLFSIKAFILSEESYINYR